MRHINNEADTFELDMGEIVETTKEWFIHLLNCVPPLRRNGSTWFIVGEPTTCEMTDGKFVDFHALLFKSKARYYATLVPENISCKCINTYISVYSVGKDIDKYLYHV